MLYNETTTGTSLFLGLEAYKWINAKKKTVVVMEAGDYSIVVNRNLSHVYYFKIRSRKSPWYEADQIIAAKQCSVVYFKECVKDIFKSNCIYPVRIVDTFNWYRKLTMAELTRALKDLYKPKKSKRKHKPQFKPLNIQEWEWEWQIEE